MSGKTSIGQKLAGKLNLGFVDTDKEIEKLFNKTIEEIFSSFGEDYFRKVESDTIRTLSEMKDTVISTGGGVVLNTENMTSLKQHSKVFYLDTPLDILIGRAKSNKTRPPLTNLNIIEETMLIYNQRDILYRSYSDVIIDCSKSKSEIIQEIIRYLNEQ